jgi:arabinofuranan 3-O-arabinosyltransferase
MLWTKPGVVSDDTKTYLYLDPGRLLRQAVSMWNPNVALGTVTHQNIGYLLPMGPFFWLFSVMHVPVWVAQRLWLGSILFAAAAGVLYLCRLLAVEGVGRIVAGVAYSLSPYVMQYAGRISVILLPFCGLPWMVAFVVLALRRPGWRYPALFAVVAALVSGINASSVVYVAAAPLLWLPYAVLVLREATGRAAWRLAAQVVVLSLLTSLWWIAGLAVEGLFGLDILKYTETAEAASSAAASSEVIRGLGYWYFYNGDRVGPWTQSSVELTTRSWLLAFSYAVPIGAFLSAALTRWRERAYFVLLVLVGLVLSVGPHPFQSPTPLGALDKAFISRTTVGLALRSTDRATPLVVLGLAMLLGAGVSAVADRLPRLGLWGGWTAAAVAVAANAPLLGGQTVISQFSQPARPPSYVSAAAHYLDATGGKTRVYGMPGDDFAAYRYGDTVDPIWVGLIDRPFATREQLIQGSMPTANFLYALDGPLQQGTMDWRALAPMARLMSAGDVLVDYDEQFERYDSPRPTLLQHELAAIPPGLGRPIGFGRPRRNVSRLPMLDETYFGLPPRTKTPAPVAIYPLRDPLAILRADSLRDPVIVAGDNVGVADAADVGLLRGEPTILFSGTLDTSRALAAQVFRHPAQLVVTDTNRKQAFEWNSLAENTGYTETAAERASAFVADDPGFDMFPGAPVSSMTTSVLPGVASVTASSYGTADTLRSEFRPANAIDGDLRTAWETEGTGDSPIVGQWWQVSAHRSLTADRLRLVQPQFERNAGWLTNQWVTRVTVTFDGSRPVTARLGPKSRQPEGQIVAFSPRSFRTVRVRIDETNLTHDHPQPVGSSLVGFAEIDVGDIHTAQVIAMPTDLLNHVGPAFLRDRLTLIMTRDRVAPVPPRSDPEVSMVRQFLLPATRSFALVATGRLSNLVPDNVIDTLVGRTNPLVESATSSSRMPGDLQATASATLDAHGGTVWMPGLGKAAVENSWLSYRFRHPITVRRLTLEIVSDAEHSRPRQILVSDGGVARRVVLPFISVTKKPGSLTRVPVDFAPVSGDHLRITFERVAVRQTLSYETSLETALPIGIATVSIPGVPLDRLGSQIPTRCRSDLLRLDGRPVPIAVSGATEAALGGGGLRISLCGTAAGLRLGPGLHILRAADGAVTGLDIDQLALDSAPGGSPMAEPGNGLLAPAAMPSTPAPTVTVETSSATSIRLRVTHALSPFLLVLGESLDKGWHASVNGQGLGQPVLVDGFANGWMVTAGMIHGRSRALAVTLTFAPQAWVDVALAISSLALLACLGIVLASMLRPRRRRRHSATPAGSAARFPSAPAKAPARPSKTAALAPPHPAGSGCRASPGRPCFSSPVTSQAGALRTRPLVGAIVGAGLVGFVVGGPAVGAGAPLVVLATAVLSRRRAVTALGAAAVMAVGAGAVVVQEHVNRYAAGGGWPSHFGTASDVIWAAATVLSIDAGTEVLAAIRQGRRSRNSAGGAGSSAASDGAPLSPER